MLKITIKLLGVLIVALLCSCGGHLKNYKVPNKYRQGGCAYFYAGECWNKISLKGRWIVDSSGYPAKQTKKARMKELLNKAYDLLLKSPPDAPHSMIWLVYIRLRLQLNDPEEFSIRTIRPRTR